MSESSRITWRDWATVPNAITLLRFALVVPAVALIVQDARPVLAFVLLVCFGASDWVDGALARALGQTSRVGAAIDPIADRTGVAAIFVAFVIAGHLPLWVAIVIVAVDLATAGTYLAVRPEHHPPVTWLGKIRTALLMLGIGFIGLGLLPGLEWATITGRWVCAVGAPLHLVAGAGYIRTMLAERRGAVRA